jgi:hypothetical protein
MDVQLAEPAFFFLLAKFRQNTILKNRKLFDSGVYLTLIMHIFFFFFFSPSLEFREVAGLTIIHRGLSQIQLQVREESRILLEACYILASS